MYKHASANRFSLSAHRSITFTDERLLKNAKSSQALDARSEDGRLLPGESKKASPGRKYSSEREHKALKAHAKSLIIPPINQPRRENASTMKKIVRTVVDYEMHANSMCGESGFEAKKKRTRFSHQNCVR